VTVKTRRRFRIDGVKVREYRERNGMDQSTFAGRVGVSQPYMSNVERGRANPSAARVLLIARELGVQFDDITTDTMQREAAAS
jgi:transcriptional regulator with XRE-family HTH domain